MPDHDGTRRGRNGENPSPEDAPTTNTASEPAPGRRRRKPGERPDNPTVLGDRETRGAEETRRFYEEGHEPRPFSLGRNPSPARVEDYEYMRFLELARNEEHDADVARGGLPEERYDELRAQAALDTQNAKRELTRAERKIAEQWAMTSTVANEPEPDEKNERVVIAAVLMLPYMFWFLLRLACKTGNNRTPARKLVASTVLAMAFMRGRPEIWEKRMEFDGAHPLLHWAFLYPCHQEKPPRRQNFYPAVHTVLSVDNLDPRLVEHLQVEAFRQFATQIEGLDRQGRPRLKHPKAGFALVVDGSFTEGQAPQKPYADEEQRRIRVRYRDDRGGVRLRVYGRDGNFERFVVGYKLCALVCAVTGRAAITAVVPADAHETDVALYLLERLFELWPEAPVHYLVGDKLYGHGFHFLRELVFRFGVDPVVPWRRDYPVEPDMHRGVPLCDCAKQPMRLKGRKDKWWGHENRLADPSMRRGVWAPRRLRLEFMCALKNARCPNKTRNVWEAPHTATALPHVGPDDCEAVALRHILEWQRNIVEAFYGNLQRLGKQRRGVDRPAWANDVEVHWMLGLAALFLTVRRHVFESGLFDRARAEAQQLGLLDAPDEDHPAPGPGRDELAAARELRRRTGEPPGPPRSIVEMHDGWQDHWTGSAADWAARWAPVRLPGGRGDGADELEAAA